MQPFVIGRRESPYQSVSSVALYQQGEAPSPRHPNLQILAAQQPPSNKLYIIPRRVKCRSSISTVAAARSAASWAVSTAGVVSAFPALD